MAEMLLRLALNTNQPNCGINITSIVYHQSAKEHYINNLLHAFVEKPRIHTIL
jgi:hypothetical protein